MVLINLEKNGILIVVGCPKLENNWTVQLKLENEELENRVAQLLEEKRLINNKYENVKIELTKKIEIVSELRLE